MEEILIPLGFFGTVAGVWIMNILAGQRARTEAADVARKAIELGQPLTPELFSFMQKPIRAPEHDLRTGIILCALALGFFATALAFPPSNPVTVRATAVAEGSSDGAVQFDADDEALVIEPASTDASSEAASDAASSAASDAGQAASAVVTITDKGDGAEVVVTRNGKTETRRESAEGRLDVDGTGFMIPGILVGFFGLGHLASWAIRRPKVA